jgi:acylphosphatase
MNRCCSGTAAQSSLFWLWDPANGPEAHQCSGLSEKSMTCDLKQKGEMTVFLVVHGRVQNVMFRQTIMRAAIKRGLVAGATNVRSDRTRVDISLSGDPAKIQEIVDGLKSGKALNSWGAFCETVEVVQTGKEPLQHEVNTANVNNIKWKKGVKFYL